MCDALHVFKIRVFIFFVHSEQHICYRSHDSDCNLDRKVESLLENYTGNYIEFAKIRETRRK